MSIDAKIAAVTIIAPDDCPKCHGKDKSWDGCEVCHGATKEKPQVRLKLVPSQKGACAGQDVLTIINPPDADLSGLIGTTIWGGSGSIMIGETLWANRVGYTRIELV